MKSNDNTVNIESERSGYHHGDLRAALIAEGLKCLDEGPAEALSLRKLARQIGVSATAVYRHFPDKASLISALCDVGDLRLGEVSSKAMAGAKTGEDALNAMGRAYVRFALANPALFRLMMSGRGEELPEDPDPRSGMGMLMSTIRKVTSHDTSPKEREKRQLKAWALVHGLAMLMLDGRIPADESLIDTVIDADGLVDD